MPGQADDAADRRIPPRLLALAALIGVLIVIPRAILISHAHSEYWDDQYHLERGLAVIERHPAGLAFNDPPLGEAIEALPLYVMGIRARDPHVGAADAFPPANNILYAEPYSPETLLMIVAIWKAVLFIPAAVVVFVWTSELYGVAAGWLALGIILIEPTIAAHISTAGLDVLAMEAVLIACFAAWKCAQQATITRGILTGIACAAAMLTKQIGLITPFVAFAIFVTFSRRKPRMYMRGSVALSIMLSLLLSLWALTLFDCSRPADVSRPMQGLLAGLAATHLPAGVYIGSIIEGFSHAATGHHAFLFGHVSDDGFWYYPFAVALFKIPIGIWLIILLALLSTRFLKSRRDELFLLIPALALTALLMISRISIGFRHFLPAYVFYLMLASRIAANGASLRYVAWTLLAIALADTLTFHPDYLSYVNLPYTKPQWLISDSNLDWGQGLKEVRAWLAKHPQSRPVYLRTFSDPKGIGPYYYFPHGVTILGKNDPAPPNGILIISMVRESGAYDRGTPYTALKDVKPIAVIGHAMSVYNLADFPRTTGQTAKDRVKSESP
jgi:hypothetical protein